MKVETSLYRMVSDTHGPEGVTDQRTDVGTVWAGKIGGNPHLVDTLGQRRLGGRQRAEREWGEALHVCGVDPYEQVALVHWGPPQLPDVVLDRPLHRRIDVPGSAMPAGPEVPTRMSGAMWWCGGGPTDPPALTRSSANASTALAAAGSVGNGSVLDLRRASNPCSHRDRI